MKEYVVRADVKGFARITFDDVNTFRRVTDLCSTGEPILESTILPVGYLSRGGYYNKQAIVSDCPFLSNTCLVISQYAYSKLEKYIKGFCDVIPMRLSNTRDKFLLLNVYTKDYINKHGAMGHYSKVHNDNDSYDIDRKCPCLYKKMETLTQINCTTDFQDIVRINNLSGFWFYTDMSSYNINPDSNQNFRIWRV